MLPLDEGVLSSAVLYLRPLLQERTKFLPVARQEGVFYEKI